MLAFRYLDIFVLPNIKHGRSVQNINPTFTMIIYFKVNAELTSRPLIFSNLFKKKTPSENFKS